MQGNATVRGEHSFVLNRHSRLHHLTPSGTTIFQLASSPLGSKAVPSLLHAALIAVHTPIPANLAAAAE